MRGTEWKERRRAVCPVSMILWALALLCGSVNAQGTGQSPDFLDKQVSLQGESQAFNTFVENISRQIGRSILVDSEPLLMKATLTFRGPARDALDHVANTFDYTWAVNKHGVILMNKRFRTLEDYPRIGLAEMRKLTQDVLRVLHALPYERTGDDYRRQLTALYYSFTPTQKEWVHAGNTLYFRDLFPAQQEMLRQGILSGVFGYLCKDWENLRERLDMIPRASLFMRCSVNMERPPDVTLVSDDETGEHMEFVCRMRSIKYGIDVAVHLVEILIPRRK